MNNKIITLASLLLLSTLLAGCDNSNKNSGNSDFIAADLETTSTHVDEQQGDIEIHIVLKKPTSTAQTFRVELVHVDTDDDDVSLSQPLIDLAANASSTTFTININDDNLPEPAEAMMLVLYDASSDRELGRITLIISDNDQLPSLPQQAESWPQTGVFAPATMCGECHSASTEGDTPALMRTASSENAGAPSATGKDISPLQGRRHATMTHAFTDPYFRAKMKHETEISPQLASFIEDKCLSCHTPMAHTHSHQTGASLATDDSCILSDGCYLADTALN